LSQSGEAIRLDLLEVIQRLGFCSRALPPRPFDPLSNLTK
jgi:hypothetical protein